MIKKIRNEKQTHKILKADSQRKTQKVYCLNLFLHCLGIQVTGIDVEQTLIAMPHIDVNQPANA